ncbi:MAG TPA: 50S ribosomal protein L4 [Candidatus Acidoferrum sp.]|jgi:large subunit ribosomal protein L4|nr:50S ribosomal protein L4 [Candidatus Acidoferrum sp.]
MAVVDIKNLQGKNVGQVELPDAVYAAKVNPNLLHETVRWYQASQRAGTHRTKGRGEVSGSGRKLWKQKGTGRARVGSIRSSIWRKGGTVHGPQPRSYAYRLPRKMLLGALRSALSAKLAEEKLTVVDAWQLESHKTKAFRAALDRLDGETKTMLLVENIANRNLELASRNLEGVKLVAPHALQPYDLLRHERLVLSKDAAVRLGETLGPREAAPASDVVQIETAEQAAAPKKAKPAAKKKVPAAKKAAKKPAAKKKGKGKK